MPLLDETMHYRASHPQSAAFVGTAVMHLRKSSPIDETEDVAVRIPLPIAIGTAAIEALSGASQRRKKEDVTCRRRPSAGSGNARRNGSARPSKVDSSLPNGGVDHEHQARSDRHPGKDQREALEDSFEKSSAKQPETFRDEANEDKAVEIPPDKTKTPIRGIDAPERPGR